MANIELIIFDCIVFQTSRAHVRDSILNGNISGIIVL
jgi:hypothetical protein